MKISSARHIFLALQAPRLTVTGSASARKMWRAEDIFIVGSAGPDIQLLRSQFEKGFLLGLGIVLHG